VGLVVVIAAVLALTGGQGQPAASVAAAGGNQAQASATASATARATAPTTAPTTAPGNGAGAVYATQPFQMVTPTTAGGLQQDSTFVSMASGDSSVTGPITSRISCIAQHLQATGRGHVSSNVYTLYDVSGDVLSNGFQGALFVGLTGAYKPEGTLHYLVYSSGCNVTAGNPSPELVPPGPHLGQLFTLVTNPGNGCIWMTRTTIGVVLFIDSNGNGITVADPGSVCLRIRDGGVEVPAGT
jgi:hypothetical protein